jgi:hypothetical protein
VTCMRTSRSASGYLYVSPRRDHWRKDTPEVEQRFWGYLIDLLGYGFTYIAIQLVPDTCVLSSLRLQ